MRTSKRNSDKRKIRVTKTYTVSDIALTVGKSERTVMSWIRNGSLKTIDDLNPRLVYGYVFKTWHIRWWDGKKKPTSPDTIYCFKCRGPCRPDAGSIRVGKTATGGMRASAKCEICNTDMYKTVSTESLDALYRGASLSGGEQRFVDSDTATVNPPSEADSAVHAEDKAHNGRTQFLPCNTFNERLKLRYYAYLHDVEGKSEATVHAVEVRLMRFESNFKFRDFGILSKGEAKAFKQSLRDGPLTPAVVLATIEATKRFLIWLRGQRNVPRQPTSEAIEHLNLTKKERRSARSIEKIRSFPDFNNLENVINRMPASTLTERRDRAMFTLLAITGVRSGVLPTLRFRHLDVSARVLYQVGGEVNTKFGKNISTILIPMRPGLVDIVLAYEVEMRSLGFTDDDPLFPKATNRMTMRARSPSPELSREFFSDAQVFGRIVKAQFVANGLKAYPIHSLRHSFGQLQNDPRVPFAVVKAISENLGHSSVRVTATSYGRPMLDDRKRIIEEHFSADPVTGIELDNEEKKVLIKLAERIWPLGRG